jgi:hypothetical protein
MVLLAETTTWEAGGAECKMAFCAQGQSFPLSSGGGIAKIVGARS